MPTSLPEKISSHFVEVTGWIMDSAEGFPVQSVDRFQSPLNGASLAIICVGNANSRNALEANAGLKMFAPAPPKACLTSTEPKSAARMIAQTDVEEGTISARRNPETREL